MATTKHRLAEQAQRILAGGDPSDDFRPGIPELALAVPQIMAKLVWKSYHEHKQDDQISVNGQFIVGFDDVEVLLDEKKKLYYATLPSSPIKLPHDMGVHTVSLMEDQTNPFVPVPNGFMALARNLVAGQLEGRDAYFIEGPRAYFVGMKASDEITKVLIKMVVTGSDLDNDDEFEIAPEMELDLIQALIELYSTQVNTPEDSVNDNQDRR